MNIDKAHAKIKKDTEIMFERIRNLQVKYIRSITPVDTGFLRDGWLVDDETNKTGNYEIVNYVPYASFINNGTEYIKPFNMTHKTNKRTPALIKLSLKGIF